ncbi:MAG: type IX secretion system membrane protein PorP/SprF [Treponema sp.]|jgi:hypothetical protein|nr:type IX secretion system membrane protein PorP/SprF [Treponema sp.]
MKNIAALLCLMTALVPLFSQETPVTIRGDVTTIYTLGNAGEMQILPSGTGDGAYIDKKNGFYTNAALSLSYKPVPFAEGFFKIAATIKPGSFYVPLQLEPSGKSDFALTFDAAWGRINVIDGLGFDAAPVNLFLKAGKYRSESYYVGKISKFETESVLYMLKTANTYNYTIGAEYDAGKPYISAALTTNYLFDEAIPRLYDSDGSVSVHGQPVLGEYAPQLYAAVAMRDFTFLERHALSAEILYALNGANIYSGNSFGASVKYTLPVGESISIPVGLSAGFYEKNIDVLAGAANDKTTDFRETFSFGYGAGLRYAAPFFTVDVNLAGAYSNISHIYRDPLSIASLSLDAYCTFMGRFFVGAGFVAGTLTDAVWKTKQTAEPSRDNGGYEHTFSFADNIGWEVYTGLQFQKNVRFIIGFNNNKGLAMNYTLESRPDAHIKYKQTDTEIANNMYEITGLFVKMSFSF